MAACVAFAWWLLRGKSLYVGNSEPAFPVCCAGRWVFSCCSYLQWLVQLGSYLFGCQVQRSDACSPSLEDGTTLLSIWEGVSPPPTPQVYTWLTVFAYFSLRF